VNASLLRKALAVVLALVPALGAAAVAYLLWFIWSFPWENSEPHTAADRRGFAVLLVATFAALLLAVVVVYFVARSRLRPAALAFVPHAVIALGLLVWALGASEHSDGRVAAFAIGCELCGVTAVLLSAASQAPRAG